MKRAILHGTSGAPHAENTADRTAEDPPSAPARAHGRGVQRAPDLGRERRGWLRHSRWRPRKPRMARTRTEGARCFRAAIRRRLHHLVVAKPTGAAGPDVGAPAGGRDAVV